MTDRFHARGVLCIAALFFVCEALEIPKPRDLRGDETFYIVGAHTMMESGDWLTPRYETGAVRFQKPILTYWLVGASMRAFGVGLPQARIPSLFLALATLPFVYGLGRVLLRDRAAAVWAVIVHASSVAVYGNAYQARTDTPLSFFVIAAMYFFARVIFLPGHERRDAILAYLAVAGAILIKGFAGFGFILLPVAVFLLLFRRQVGAARWRAVASPWGIAVMALLIAPWFSAVLIHYGRTFVNTFWGDQVGQRVHGSKWYLLSNLIEYPYLFLRGSLPWGPIVMLGLAARDVPLRDMFRGREGEWKFLATWFGVTYLILHGANITRGRYLLPIMPVFSLLVGQFLSLTEKSGSLQRGGRWGVRLFAVASILFGIVCLGQFAVLLAGGEEACLAEAIISALMVGVGAALFPAAHRGSVRAAALGIAAGMMVCQAAVNAFLAPTTTTEITAYLARAEVRRYPKEIPVSTVAVPEHGRAAVLLFAGRRVRQWTDSVGPRDQEQFVRKLLSAGGPQLILMDDTAYSALPTDLRTQLRLLASRSGIGVLRIESWLRGTPKTLHALLKASEITHHLLLYDPSAQSGAKD